MNVYCWGDSLTLGQLGYSYIPYYNQKYNFKNFGKNGDTIHGIFERMFFHITHENNVQGVYIIASGTNDLLLQYKKTASFFWNLRAERLILKQNSTKNIHEFEQMYRTGIKKLKAYTSNIIILGIPYFEIKDFPLHKIQNYNSVIKNIASDYDIPFIDVYKIQKNFINSNMKNFCKYNFFEVMFQTIFMKLWPNRKDLLSKKNKLSVTVDGVHFNTISAKEISKEVEKTLLIYE